MSQTLCQLPDPLHQHLWYRASAVLSHLLFVLVKPFLMNLQCNQLAFNVLRKGRSSSCCFGNCSASPAKTAAAFSSMLSRSGSVFMSVTCWSPHSVAVVVTWLEIGLGTATSTADLAYPSICKSCSICCNITNADAGACCCCCSVVGAEACSECCCCCSASATSCSSRSIGRWPCIASRPRQASAAALTSGANGGQLVSGHPLLGGAASAT